MARFFLTVRILVALTVMFPSLAVPVIKGIPKVTGTLSLRTVKICILDDSFIQHRELLEQTLSEVSKEFVDQVNIAFQESSYASLMYDWDSDQNQLVPQICGGADLVVIFTNNSNSADPYTFGISRHDSNKVVLYQTEMQKNLTDGADNPALPGTLKHEFAHKFNVPDDPTNVTSFMYYTFGDLGCWNDGIRKTINKNRNIIWPKPNLNKNPKPWLGVVF